MEARMSVLSGSSILVTGGTGSFGKAFIQELLDNDDPRRIVIFSRDELKQYECRQRFNDDPRLRWFLGDIRDLLESGRVDDVVDAVHGPVEPVQVADVAQEPAQAGVIVEPLAAFVLLELVTAEDDDASGVVVVQELLNEGFAERSRPAGDENRGT